jgi:AcrR family transcriptional regulator
MVRSMRSTKSRTRPKAPLRDREATRARILGAVGELLAEQGFRALGINAIARRARADKALIYRYFGGLPELLAAYAEEGDFWWKAEDIVGGHLRPRARDTLAEWIGLVFRRHVAALKARPATLEIMAWETIERNELTSALAAVREARSLAVMETLTDRFARPAGFDAGALGALLGAATNYLLIRSRSIRVFQGVDLGKAAGWERILSTIEKIASAMAKD